jgi:glutathione peroxidase
MLSALCAAPATAQQAQPAAPKESTMASIYDVKVQPMTAAATTTVTGNTLAPYKGKVMLIVNVASYCGNTPQYSGLEALNLKYRKQGLQLVGFPSNDFGGQEPGTGKEIVEFCTMGDYHITFPLYAKVHALAKPDQEQSPIYKYLLANAPPEAFKGPVQWNFEKWLVSRDGKVVARFSNRMKPDDPALAKAIEAELAKPAPPPEKRVDTHPAE